MGNEEKKKDCENQCLNKAVKLGLMQHGKSRLIIQRLASPDFGGCNQERPDFIKLYESPSSTKCPTVVGIEHFRVDRMSLSTKDQKVASTGIVKNKRIEKILNEYNLEAEKGDVSKRIFDRLGKVVANYMEEQLCSSYNILLESFKYSMNHHLNFVDEYRKNLTSISCSKFPIELIFLIEIHADFTGLYCADDCGIHKKENNLMPIFEEIVCFMEENIDPRKVNYVILCIENELGCSDYEVVAFSTKNIRKDLEKQRIRIYEYAGEDLQYPKFTAREQKIPIKSSYDTTEDGANIHLETQGENVNDRYNGVPQEMEHAYNLISCGKNVMMTSAVYGCFLRVQESYFNRKNKVNDAT